VILTAAAEQFITALTLESLSEEPVIRHLFGEEREEGIRHISLTEECDLLLVAPATANIIGKFAGGLADDFLSTFFLANRAPVVIAPAMTPRCCLMRRSKRTSPRCDPAESISSSQVRAGSLAAGWEREARRARRNRGSSESQARQGLELGWGARPGERRTDAEPIDPVRVLTNRSSGKMGYRLAQAARDRGAKVRLVSGPPRKPTREVSKSSG